MIRYLTLCALGLALLAPSARAQVTASVSAGYDDNPFRLSGQFDRREGGFIDSEIRLEHGFGHGFGLDARAGYLASQSEDGDRSDFSVTLDYQHEARLFGQPAEYLLHVRGVGSDRSFISRNTGEIGTFGGTPIADRFDQTSLEVRARADITLSEDWTLRLQGDGRSRSYRDYAALGLSNLDYDQIFAHARLRFWPENRVHDGQLGVSVGHRVFDDRRGRALDTGSVTGSNLEFNFFTVDASWKTNLHPHHDVRLAYSFDAREDNATGYYDTTLHRTRLRYRYRPSWSRRFAAELEYRDFNYENIPASLIINNEENVAPHDGLRLTVSYDQRLARSETREVWFDASLSYDDIESPNTNFTYDRWVARVGVSIEFGRAG